MTPSTSIGCASLHLRWILRKSCIHLRWELTEWRGAFNTTTGTWSPILWNVLICRWRLFRLGLSRYWIITMMMVMMGMLCFISWSNTWTWSCTYWWCIWSCTSFCTTLTRWEIRWISSLNLFISFFSYKFSSFILSTYSNSFRSLMFHRSS